MSADVGKKRRWLPVALGVSLALNLLVIGIVAGTAWRMRGGGEQMPPGVGFALFRALPDEDRKALRAELKHDRKAGAQRRSADFRALSDALRTVPFDPDAVQVLVADQARRNAETYLAVNRGWLARVEAMTDAERADYADRLDDAVRHGRRRSGKRH